MSTPDQSDLLDAALANLPAALRKRAVESYMALKRIPIQNEYDAIGVRAGKLAEALLRVLQHVLTGTYTPLSRGLGNFRVEALKIEQTPTSAGPEGLRLLMPRALLFMYTLRNKRDFGHVGGEVDANAVDAVTALRLADWCMAELVRVSRSIPIDDAQVLCDAMIERQVPLVWNVLGRKRILATGLSYRDQTLLLLYAELEEGVPTEDLFAWTEHSNRGAFRRDVLGPLHRSRLIEWDQEMEMAILSPRGIQTVEEVLLPKVSARENHSK